MNVSFRPTKAKLIRWDFFDRPENKNFDPDNVRCVMLNIPADYTLREALEYARATRNLGSGTHRSGCFEVQNDLGIFRQVDGNKIDLSTPAKAAKVTFKTWEQLEREEP